MLLSVSRFPLLEALEGVGIWQHLLKAVLRSLLLDVLVTEGWSAPGHWQTDACRAPEPADGPCPPPRLGCGSAPPAAGDGAVLLPGVFSPAPAGASALPAPRAAAALLARGTYCPPGRVAFLTLAPAGASALPLGTSCLSASDVSVLPLARRA